MTSVAVPGSGLDTSASRAGEQAVLDKAKALDLDLVSEAFAARLDGEDELSSFRQQFLFPQHNGEPSVYLCGNSLGLQPRTVRQYVNEELDSWAERGVEGHFHGKRPWVGYPDIVLDTSASLVGAQHAEVSVMLSLTANLHFMMVPFYRPSGDRFKILLEGKAFPSDRYAVRSQVSVHGYTEDEAIIELQPREGEVQYRTEDVLRVIKEHGSSIALILLPGVQYYTGEVFDIAAITQAGHEMGCMVGWDLAHAVGNIELKLHDWNVDFAAWCSYKYLNSGPGGIAGFFVHQRHGSNAKLPRFSGWWGQRMDTRFDMTQPFDPTPGAQGFQVSNPPVLQTVSLLASLEIFQSAGMPALSRKSRLLTGYLAVLLQRELGEQTVRILTPVERRGCQLSLQFSQPVDKVHQRITQQGVICDVRKPDVMRIAPAPLYNSFQDVRRFVMLLKQAITDDSPSV